MFDGIQLLQSYLGLFSDKFKVRSVKPSSSRNPWCSAHATYPCISDDFNWLIRVYCDADWGFKIFSKRLLRYECVSLCDPDGVKKLQNIIESHINVKN